MPHWVELMPDDSVKVSEQGILDGKIVQVDLKRESFRPISAVYSQRTTHVGATSFELSQSCFHTFNHSSLDLLHHIRHGLIQLDDICFSCLKRVLDFFVEPELISSIQIRTGLI